MTTGRVFIFQLHTLHYFYLYVNRSRGGGGQRKKLGIKEIITLKKTLESIIIVILWCTQQTQYLQLEYSGKFAECCKVYFKYLIFQLWESITGMFGQLKFYIKRSLW